MSARSAVVFAAVAVVLGFLALLALSGCRVFESAVPRETARAAVVTTAEAVRASSEACAAFSLANRDLELARKCARAYDAARLSLIAIGTGVDAWDTWAARDSVTCAARHASAELAVLVRELEAHGGRPPPIAADALALVSLLAPCVENAGEYPAAGGAR